MPHDEYDYMRECYEAEPRARGAAKLVASLSGIVLALLLAWAFW